jgi:hypothetical protein
MASETTLTLGAGTNATVSTTVLAGTRHVRGRLADRQDPARPLAGVQIILVGNFGRRAQRDILRLYRTGRHVRRLGFRRSLVRLRLG